MHIYLLILNYVDFHLKSIQEGEKNRINAHTNGKNQNLIRYQIKS